MKNIKEFYQVEATQENRTVKGLSRPINMNLIITKRCNANCIHCCASANNTKETLSLENLKKIIQIARKNDVFYFVITGGEPLMYKHFWTMLDLFNDEFGMIINTNGTLIDEKTGKRLSEYNIASVHISLDAADEEMYKKQRGNTTKLEQVIRGIKNLVQNKVKVTTKMVITDINKDSVEEVVRLSISLGVKKISLAWFKPVGRGLTNEKELNMKPEDIKRVAGELYRLREKYKDEIRMSFDDTQCFPFLLKNIDEIRYRKLCGDYFFRVDYNGDVFPCPFMETKIGNIFKKGLKELWRDPRLTEQRTASWGENLKGVCQSCNQKMMCAGGCRARAIAINGDIRAKDPLCWAE